MSDIKTEEVIVQEEKLYNLVIILGSVRKVRNCDRVLKYITKKLNTTNKFKITVLDPRELNLGLVETRKIYIKI
jgi:hypothetical protein